MSVPAGAKIISSINTSKFTYLISDEQLNPKVIYSYNKNYFSTKGKPIGNLTTDKIPEQLLKDLGTMLPERGNNTTTILGDYPALTSPDTNFSLNVTKETDISVIFLDEGAGYWNSLGYYMWIEQDGLISILANSDANIDGSEGHYNPTIIFPNASLGTGGSLRSDGELVPGHRRKLFGNLPNGKFSGVNVGFFVIPNGWKDRNNGVVYNNKSVIYSDRSLNTVGEKESDDDIQSVIFDYGDRKIVAFEDIKRPGGDSDFNDLIFQVETTPTITGNYIQPKVATVSDTIFKKDFFGLFISDTNDKLTGTNTSYKGTRVITFDTEENKKRHNFLMENLHHEVAPKVTDLSKTSCKYDYTFTSDDVANNKVDGKLKYYVFLKESNEEDTVVVISGLEDDIGSKYNGSTSYKLLVSLQHNENVAITEENQYVTTVDNSYTYTQNEQTTVANVQRSLLVWGDPHIKTIYGNTITIAHEGVFEFFNDGHLVVNIECWKHPDYVNHKNKNLRNGTFIKKIAFIYKREIVKIDMNDLYNYKSTNLIKVEPENSKYHYVSLFNKNRDPEAKTIYISCSDYVFNCSILPSIDDILNELRLINTDILFEKKLKTIKGLITGKIKQIRSLC